MSSYSSTFFPVYYIQNKNLHLVSPSYFPQEKLDNSKINRFFPFFIEGEDCNPNSNNITISTLGCLYFSPPAIAANATYKFSRGIPGLISIQGLSGPESWGLWTDDTIVTMKILIDSSVYKENYSEWFINLETKPFLFAHIHSQPISIKSNLSNKIFNYDIGQEGWISVPIDLKNLKSNSIEISIMIPNAIAPSSINKSYNDSRKLGIGLLSLSLTSRPVNPSNK